METDVTASATTQAFEPRYIRLDAHDNVAIVVNDFGLPANTRFPCGLELRNFVPQGHKVALTDIAEGAAIRRYNEVIGTAARPILAGEWVDEARIRMPTPPELDKLELATAVPAPQPPLEGYTFEGFRNPDGSIALLVLNNADAPAEFWVSWRERSFKTSLSAGSIATYLWHPRERHLSSPEKVSPK